MFRADLRGEFLERSVRNTARPAAVVNDNRPSRIVSAIDANAIVVSDGIAGSNAATSGQTTRTTGIFLFVLIPSQV